MSDCQKEKYEGRCCCTCIHHQRDFLHPSTIADGYKHGAVSNIQKGWVCFAPEFEGVYSGWPAHGLCEMHETWDEKTKYYRQGNVEMEDSQGKFKVGLIEEIEGATNDE